MYQPTSVSSPASEMPPWLASLILKRGGGALARFAVHYQRLASMPRAWRARLRRKLAVSLSSAALIMALAGPVVMAAPDAPDATINVVNGEVANVNNNKCGLIEAIINARTSNPGGMRPDCTAGNVNGPDTITLPNNGLFVLTEAHNSQFGDTGLPVITSAVILEGRGSTIRRSTASSTPEFRILAVDPAGALTLRDATITNGLVQDYPNDGGGILAYGALTLSNATVSNNRASYGGGIASNGPLAITNSTIANNVANYDYYGGGGGLLISEDSHATITGSRILDNESAGGYGIGGGGLLVHGEADIVDSVIAGNHAGGAEGRAEGGGILVYGEATISGTTINDNEVGSWFEAFSYEMHPGMGGGVGNEGTTLIVNSTISNNSASIGGGLGNFGYGQMTVIHSTVTGNEAVSAVDPYDNASGGFGGGFASGPDYNRVDESTTTLKGVILSGNTAEDSAPQARLGASATITVNAFNVFGQNGNAGVSGFNTGATDVVPSAGLAAILGPLANNGGPTPTHALPANSPALDLAPNASCTAAPVGGVDQRGEPRNQNGVGSVTNNECDAGAFERGSGATQMGFYLSTTGSGSVGGVSFAPGDIIKFAGGTWSLHFDASDVGITKNVTAFAIEENGDILLSLAAKQNVAGAGTVQPQDVIRFTPVSTGNNTAGTFVMALDGSANLLTTSGEKIDALARTNGRIALSTAGAASVKRPDNTVLKAQDEDALGFNLANNQWSEFFNGTAIPGLKAEDVNALWIDQDSGDLYISIVGTFNLGGVSGNARDIVKLTPSGAPGGYTPSLFWDGSANGFPTNIDGLEMIP